MVSTQWAPESMTMPQPPSLRSTRQCQPPTFAGSLQPAFTAHHIFGVPSRSPSWKAQWMARWPMARRHCSAVAATRPRFLAVAAIFFDAFTVMPIGFSHSTLTPPSSSWQASTWCRPWGLQMSPPSIRTPLSSSISTLLKVATSQPRFACRRLAKASARCLTTSTAATTRKRVSPLRTSSS